MKDLELESVDESLRKRFEAAWHAEEPISIEDCLPERDSPSYLATLEELIAIDLEYSWKRSAETGQGVLLEDYLERFPALKQPEILQRLVEEEQHARQRCGESPQAGDYQRRFPQVALTQADLETSVGPPRTSPGGPSMPLGSQIGNYRLLQQIGEGGFGEVYLAEQLEPVRRQVALKIIKPGMDSRAVLTRFEAERQALAMMDHENLARVFDGGVAESGRPYFVMELVRGVPITAYCDDHQFTPRERLELFIPVCRALQHAHQKGIIHRDIKPSNVMVALQDGQPVPKVIDFGVAKAIEQPLTEKTLFTEYGQVIGTPQYMSPEQAEFNQLDIDTRSDIYSLGVLLYELLTGTPPLQIDRLRGAGFEEMLRMIREEEAPKPSTRISDSGPALATISAQRRTEPAKLGKLFRGELDWIVMKAMEKDRTRRYESAGAFAEDLRRYLDHEPVAASPPSATYRLRKFARKHRVWLATASAFLLVLLSATAISLWQAAEANRQRDLAQASQRETENAQRETEQALEETKQAQQATEVALQESRQSQQKAQAVADFMIAAFRLPDPEYQGQNLTVKELLSWASEGLQESFTEDPLTKAALLQALGQTYAGFGDHTKAIELSEQADQLWRENLDESAEEVLISMQHLGNVYRQAGRAKEAVKIHEQAFRLMEDKVGPEHRDTLTALNNLAESFNANGETDAALLILQRVHKQMQELTSPDDPARLKVASNLAAALLAAGHYQEALSLQKSVVASMEKELGKKHVSTLTALSNLAETYDGVGNVKQAFEVQKEVVRLMSDSLGTDHPLTLTAKNNLAGYYHTKGEHTEALALREAVLAVRNEKLEETHPDVLISLISVAESYRSLNRFEEAEELQKQVLERAREKLGTNHPSTFQYMHNLAHTYLHANRVEEAINLFQETLNLRREKLGDFHPDTLDSMSSLAEAYRFSGRTDEAVSLLEEAWGYSHKEVDSDHPRNYSLMRNLAASLLADGNIKHARQLAMSAFKDLRKNLGEHHPDFLEAMNLSAEIELALSNVGDALKLYQLAYEANLKRFGSEHLKTLVSMNNLAKTQLAALMVEEAFELQQKALESARENLGQNHFVTLTARHNLAQIHHQAGRHEASIPLQEKTLRQMELHLGENHPLTLQGKASLADFYREVGRIDEAIELAEATLANRGQQLRPGHPEVLLLKNNLAEAYRAAGRQEDSHKLHEETYQQMRKSLGANHQYTLTSLGNLAITVYEAKQIQQALTLTEQAIELREENLRDVRDHQNNPGFRALLTLNNNLAQCYAALGRLKKAERLHEENLELRQEILGSDHPETLTTLFNLAETHHAQGNIEQALVLHQEAFDLRLKTLGEDHPATRESMVNMAFLCERNETYDIAQRFYERYGKDFEIEDGQAPSMMVFAAERIAYCRIKQEDYEGVEENLKWVITAWKTIPDLYLTHDAESLLGVLKLRTKAFEEAEPLLLKGYEGLVTTEAQIPTVHKFMVREALERLAQLYENWGKPEQAARWRSKLPEE